MENTRDQHLAFYDLWKLANNLESLAYRLPREDQSAVLRLSVECGERAIAIEKRLKKLAVTL